MFTYDKTSHVLKSDWASCVVRPDFDRPYCFIIDDGTTTECHPDASSAFQRAKQLLINKHHTSIQTTFELRIMNYLRDDDDVTVQDDE